MEVETMLYEKPLQNNITDKSPTHEQKIYLSPYMDELIKKTNSEALKKQFIPQTPAYNFQFSDDYLHENEYMPVPNLIHRYESKAVIIATNQCACYCQFCTRQRITRKIESSLDNLNEILHYIKTHSEIMDVLVTGGDPLVLNTEQIVDLLKKIEEIESVKIIRIGTRIPITFPQRIDTELIEFLKTVDHLYINIHINHPDELTPESKNAILALANAGIPLGSQSVLLKDINDDYDVLKNLFQQLIQIKVKPYYLYQCDRVHGCENFIVDIRKGISIMNKLCSQITGFAIPKFVVDTPEMGKMVLAPSSIVRTDGDIFYLSNRNGQCCYKNKK